MLIFQNNNQWIVIINHMVVMVVITIMPLNSLPIMDQFLKEIIHILLNREDVDLQQEILLLTVLNMLEEIDFKEPLLNGQYQSQQMLQIGAYMEEESSIIAELESIMLFWEQVSKMMVLGLSRTLGDKDGEKQVILDWLQEILVELWDMPIEQFEMNKIEHK